MMPKKIFLFFLSAVLVLASIPGCSGSGKAAVSSQATASDPLAPTSKTITVSWFVPWWMDASDFQFVFDGFARKYPQYTIVQDSVPDLTTLLAAIQAGNQPDVWMGGDPNTTNFVSGCYQSMFTKLDGYLAKDPTMNLGNLSKALMNLTKFNGGYYALPYQTSQFCLVYNRDLFEKAGLDPDNPPATWTDYYNDAKKLTKFDSNGTVTQLGIIDGPYPYQLESLNRTNGVIAANGIDGSYTSDWVQKIYEYCGKFDKIVGSSNSLPDNVKFSIENGNAAMTANGNLSYLNCYAAASINIGIAPLPKPDGYTGESVIPSLLWYYFTLPKGSKNPNGGWLFAKYAMTDGLYQSVAKDYQDNPSGIFPLYIAHTPTRKKVYSAFLPNLPQSTQKLIKARDTMVEDTSKQYIMAYSPIHSTLNSIEQKWQKKESDGKVGLKEMLEGIQKEYETTLKTWEKDMEAKGWKFPKGQAAVPPSNY